MARQGGVWVLNRQSCSEAPNYYLTQDWRHFTALTEVAPERGYRWPDAELIHWRQGDGTRGTGILYKPSDFDPSKKYPVLFTYYERLSDQLYQYPIPDFTWSEINIPWFVSRGYIVCVPDIYFRIGEPGASVLNSVVSLADSLSLVNWVDKKHLGIQGYSWGGYETNFLVTHSKLFAAAAEGAGPTDFISGYGSLLYGGSFGVGISSEFMYEVGQMRMGATLWQRPELYYRNSPVLFADRVQTPLLMLHNKSDYTVPFEQGVEFFTALRRLGKKVWLIQHNGDGHGMTKATALDNTLRMTQFFDYYLKGLPPARWMTQGIPADQRGVDSGLDLDTSGAIPPP